MTEQQIYARLITHIVAIDTTNELERKRRSMSKINFSP
jgi:hypothetical protein